MPEKAKKLYWTESLICFGATLPFPTLIDAIDFHWMLLDRPVKRRKLSKRQIREVRTDYEGPLLDKHQMRTMVVPYRHRQLIEAMDDWFHDHVGILKGEFVKFSYEDRRDTAPRWFRDRLQHLDSSRDYLRSLLLHLLKQCSWVAAEWPAHRADNVDGTDRIVDGPAPPNLLFWDGRRSEVPPRVWHLLSFMWSRAKASLEELEAAVWDREPVSSSTVKSTVSRANQALLKADCPIRLSVKAGYVIKSCPVAN